ncbi:MAG: HK97 family phage prohead protease [Betaproteobacteria bacterium]|jgi:HK97 family phage prohead protease|nr:HK97 family phage prohead protease [Betaproteobacteria bacterium]
MQIDHAPIVELDLKSVAEDGIIEGYASRFGERDRGDDIVEAGAFKKHLRGKKSGRIPMLFGHDQSKPPVGVWTELREDAVGLVAKGRIITASDYGRHVYELLKAGADMGLSIGYRTKVAEHDTKKGVRLLKEVELAEISLVPIPMLDTARITSVKGDTPDADEWAWIGDHKAAIEALESMADFERRLRAFVSQ